MKSQTRLVVEFSSLPLTALFNSFFLVKDGCPNASLLGPPSTNRKGRRHNPSWIILPTQLPAFYWPEWSHMTTLINKGLLTRDCGEYGLCSCGCGFSQKCQTHLLRKREYGQQGQEDFALVSHIKSDNFPDPRVKLVHE